MLVCWKLTWVEVRRAGVPALVAVALVVAVRLRARRFVGPLRLWVAEFVQVVRMLSMLLWPSWSWRRRWRTIVIPGAGIVSQAVVEPARVGPLVVGSALLPVGRPRREGWRRASPSRDALAAREGLREGAGSRAGRVAAEGSSGEWLPRRPRYRRAVAVQAAADAVAAERGQGGR